MQLIRTVGREEAAKWFAAHRDETAEYRTNLQKKLVFIEHNADEPDKEAVSAVLETFYKCEAAKLKEDTKKCATTFGNKVRSIGRGQHRS